MFCPQCRVEYREGFVECSDCHIPLVDRLPEPGTPADSLIDVPEEVDEADLDVLGVSRIFLAAPVVNGDRSGCANR